MLGDYERVGVVVRGARSTVWKGFDPALKREVALKHVTAGDAAVTARREATALAGLQHPNIVSVYDVIDDDGVWLIEQWVSGAPLAAVLAHSGKMRAIDALALVHGALSGLAYAHGRDVVHGDVSPSNILIDGAGTPMLVDFGLAVAPGHSSLGGTPGYMAPEAAAGQAVDKRSDVYSSCVVLAELLKGARLFPHSLLAAAHQQGSATPELDGIERPVAAVLSAGLDRAPDNRPADAGALLAQLEPAIEKTHGRGWLAAAGLGAVGSTAATIAAGTTLTGATATATATTGIGATAAAAAKTGASTLSRGKVIGAAATGAAVIAAATAFVLLRPQPPAPEQPAAQEIAAQALPTPPAAAAPEGPVLSGKYEVVATYRTATVHEVVTWASDCPRCDATNGTTTMKWNGTGWEGTVSSGGCGPELIVYTPVGDVDGVVRNFNLLGTFLTPEVCWISGPTVGTGTLVG